ncbi:hypothetical protein AD006_03360 [Pseudonocardia sp. EC080610-09]|uniref:hypothetical protein n=1 Tax=unclassified Pseudonocardia TaxID=2619320 RepID=UPI0006CB7DA4|nr:MULTISPECIES: hypothetical protein [unclassified Pseudonocardia]ALE75234.1 hypothetical protein FRP1_24170 [Pseudonocardia sp. EC080625-04]ALL74598.1 hypothetical protein AD006_03360 [Pseudonocardia sp. EC080610-09]ALL81618.1 hypothetical protein AD017_11175 [Pseudonocardia sp. EC080619-01]
MLAVAAFTLTISAEAHAAPGDQVRARGTNALELATDACRAANFRFTVEGNPGTPNNYSLLIDSVIDPSCVTRTRLTGVRDGRVVATPYYVTNSGEPGATRVENIERCSIEFGVQRRDGSYFTQLLTPEGAASAPPQCP